MKTLLTILFILTVSMAAHSQTVCPPMPEGKVCIDQQTADEAANNKIELPKVKAALDAALKQIAAGDTALAKALQVIDIDKNLLQLKDEIIALKDRKELAYKELDAIKDKIIQTLLDLNEKLTAKLMKPKSTLQKFLDGVKEILKAVVYIGAGAAIGRVL